MVFNTSAIPARMELCRSEPKALGRSDQQAEGSCLGTVLRKLPVKKELLKENKKRDRNLCDGGGARVEGRGGDGEGRIRMESGWGAAQLVAGVAGRVQGCQGRVLSWKILQMKN